MLLKARFLCTQDALRGRMCFSEKPIPFENTGETSSTAAGDDVHVDYPQVRTGSSGTNRSRSSLSAILMDDRFLRVNRGNPGAKENNYQVNGEQVTKISV